jgi:hypothetical protein
MGTIKTYKSSEANTRGFCWVCGATVFCLTARRMPSERQVVVGIAMGILRAPEGIRAENWVTWRTRTVSWVEDARSYDADFANAISETLGLCNYLTGVEPAAWEFKFCAGDLG